MSAFEMVIVFYHDLSLTGSLSGSFHQSLTFFCLPFDEPSPYQDYSICGASIDLVRAGTFRTICIKPEIPWREHERDWSTAISASTPRTITKQDQFQGLPCPCRAPPPYAFLGCSYFCLATS